MKAWVGIAGGAVVASVIILALAGEEKNYKLGLVINTPSPEITLDELSRIYKTASFSGIARSNAYMFWDIIESERGVYEWGQYDAIIGLHQKNDLKTTLYLSVINGRTLGPFPDWAGNPDLESIPEDELVMLLDMALSRYETIDSLIISSGTDEYFRYKEGDVPIYAEFFGRVYERLKELHPGVSMGNSFELHNTLNKGLEDLVVKLALGDFAAFTYLPTDTLYEISKSPKEAGEDLDAMLRMAPGQIAILEAGWSTSGDVGGSEKDQADFVGELYSFYDENEKRIEFLTWYRLYDRPEGTCKVSSGADAISVGDNTFVIQRLEGYICGAGLLEYNSAQKPGWPEYIRQTKAR